MPTNQTRYSRTIFDVNVPLSAESRMCLRNDSDGRCIVYFRDDTEAVWTQGAGQAADMTHIILFKRVSELENHLEQLAEQLGNSHNLIRDLEEQNTAYQNQLKDLLE